MFQILLKILIKKTMQRVEDIFNIDKKLNYSGTM